MTRALALAGLLASGVAAAAPGALAVLPFKNLNSEAALDWLKLGIAETMVADLRRAGHAMVERDQVDKALAELALQGQKLDDDSRAAKAGKLMGATTVVVGGYQKAGEQLRITARFVAVETGVVERTAKVTGTLTQVFELQDQIVAELVKLKSPAGGDRRGRPTQVRRPATQKTLDAYRSYAQALASSSQTERIEKLQEALALDPGFTYAADDLKALKERLGIYEAQSARILDEKGKQLWAELEAPALSAQDRNLKAMQYLTNLQQGFRYAALLAEAQRVYGLNIPGAGLVRAHEYASFCVFLAAMSLKKTDLALQAGERHLKEFPGGTYASSVDLQLHALIETQQRNEGRRKEGRAALAEVQAERAHPRNDAQRRGLDFRLCSEASGHELWPEAEANCGAYLEAYRGQPDANNLLPLARWMVARSFYERGDFEKARGLMQALEKDAPDFARSMSLGMQLRTWPQP